MTTLDQISVNQVNQNGLENRNERERAVDGSLDQKENVIKVDRKAKNDTTVRPVQKIVPMKALKPKAVHMMRKIKKKQRKKMPGFVYFF